MKCEDLISRKKLPREWFYCHYSIVKFFIYIFNHVDSVKINQFFFLPEQHYENIYLTFNQFVMII